MKKIEYIELIQQRVAPGYPNSDLAHLVHPEIISREISSVYEDIVYQSYIQAKAKYNVSDLDNFGKTFVNVPIVQDATRGVYYAILPKDIIELPDYASIRQVYTNDPDGDESITMALIPQNATGVFNNLPVSKVDKLPSLYLEISKMDGEESATKKLVFDTMNKDYTSLNMKLIIPFYEYDDLDHVPVSSASKNQILSTVAATILGEPPQKNSNNNNDTRV